MLTGQRREGQGRGQQTVSQEVCRASARALRCGSTRPSPTRERGRRTAGRTGGLLGDDLVAEGPERGRVELERDLLERGCDLVGGHRCGEGVCL